MLSLPGVELGVLGRDEALASRGRGVIAASPRTARHARGDREARARDVRAFSSRVVMSSVS